VALMALRVCMYQGGTCNVADNLREMDAFLAERARRNDCDVVVFPELYVCGYGRESFAEVALPPGWETESELRTIVARHGLAVCVGLAERVRDKIYNSAALFSGSGRLLTVHRKTHLWGDFERAHFTAASELPCVVSLGEVLVAVCICYEVEFPEMGRAVRRKGGQGHICQLFFLSSNALSQHMRSLFLQQCKAVQIYIFLIFFFLQVWRNGRVAAASSRAYPGACI
jgi:predicted amidohydrolase